MKKLPKIVITIPAYNEERTIGKVLRKINEEMNTSKYKKNYKILVVDDGSKDNTVKISKLNKAIVFSHPRNYGLAETFRTEMDKCLDLKADIIVHFDADGQYLAKDIPKLISFVEKGYDLVMGSRFRGRIEKMPIVKKIGNMAFSMVLSNITRTRISDGQTGFRAFTKEVAKKIKIQSNHTYTQEQIIKAVKHKYRIKEVPIFFAKRRSGESRLMKSPFDYAMKAGSNIIRVYRDYEPLKFFGFMGGGVFGIGFIIGLYLVYLHLTEGIQGHIALTMLCVLILMIGIQIGLFGLFADMNRK
jgi:glycosyltransferase involved in cell wall biosynthesis